MARVDGPALMNTSLAIYIDWWVDNVDESAGTGTFHYKIYLNGNDRYETVIYGLESDGVNYFDIGGSRVYRLTSLGGYTQANPRLVYGKQDWDGRVNPWSVSRGDAFNGYAKTISTLASGSFTVYYNDSGDASVSFSGKLRCGASAGSTDWSNTIRLDRINRYNYARRASDNWNKTVRFWKTEDRGVTWKNCNGYELWNNGNSYEKL